MPSSNKNLGARALQSFVDALDDHIVKVGYTDSRSDYIIEAIIARVTAEGGALPKAKAPSSARKGERLMGWRSRLYENRYQLVAILNDGEWQINHLHNTDMDSITQPMRNTLRSETPYPLEMTIYAPDHLPKSGLQHDLGFEILTPDWAHLWDREDNHE